MFSEMALSFAVKVKLSTFVCVFFCKIMAGNCARVVRLTAVKLAPFYSFRRSVLLGIETLQGSSLKMSSKDKTR